MRLKFLLVTALFAVSSATYLHAQIKIGTNPTTIDQNSNLEVEASTVGRSFKIDKTTGKLTIADGTQGVDNVLISEADGSTRWSKLNVDNFVTLPKMIMGGARTGPLEDGVRINLKYPNVRYLVNGWSLVPGSTFATYGGSYLVETYLTIQNSEGCTGTSVMGLEVNLTTNGVVSSFVSLDERLAPVYHDKYVTKVTQVVNILGETDVSFSILPTIKSPQAGCEIKVIEGTLAMKYMP